MNITDLAQVWVERVLGAGDVAIDATVGNGHDTAFLARVVGPDGSVFGFDVQQRALDSASARLETEGLRERVTLIGSSHADIVERLRADPSEIGAAKAIMFNLGYLPGGDKNVTTEVGETMRALTSALDLLERGGILTIVLYPGHPEGARESGSVSAWAKELPPPFDATLCRPWNRSETAPYLIVVEKQGEV